MIDAHALSRKAFALSSSVRIAILQFLAQRPRTVAELVEKTRQSQGCTSEHLRVLRNAGLVSYRQQQQHSSSTYHTWQTHEYYVIPSEVAAMAQNVQELIEKQAG